MAFKSGDKRSAIFCDEISQVTQLQVIKLKKKGSSLHRSRLRWE
jgi:hypothetical protein